jgi:Integrase core domain
VAVCGAVGQPAGQDDVRPQHVVVPVFQQVAVVQVAAGEAVKAVGMRTWYAETDSPSTPPPFTRRQPGRRRLGVIVTHGSSAHALRQSRCQSTRCGELAGRYRNQHPTPQLTRHVTVSAPYGLNLTLEREWAYARPYNSNQQRLDTLPAWLHDYNHHRPHRALDGRSPMQLLNNLPGTHS